jgi:hypothetical protein
MYTTYIRTPTSRTDRANQTGFCAARARNQAAFLCGRHIKLLCQFMDSVAKRIIEHEPVSSMIALSVEAEVPQYGPNFSRFKFCRFATPRRNCDGVCGNVSHVNHIRLVLPPMTAGKDRVSDQAAQKREEYTRLRPRSGNQQGRSRRQNLHKPRAQQEINRDLRGMFGQATIHDRFFYGREKCPRGTKIPCLLGENDRLLERIYKVRRNVCAVSMFDQEPNYLAFSTAKQKFKTFSARVPEQRNASAISEEFAASLDRRSQYASGYF